MFATGKWWDTRYHAWALQGARCKSQRLRHNIMEIMQWPNMSCAHIHSPSEWVPHVLADGSTWYPSHEEAEYTACLVFHIAVAVSWWACRVGRPNLRVPRAPPIACVGDRTKWLRLDPRALREWMMLPMAVSIGLDVSRLLCIQSGAVSRASRSVAPQGQGPGLG